MSLSNTSAPKGPNNLEFADTLQGLIAALEQASEAGSVAAAAAGNAIDSLIQARKECLMPAPSKWTLLDHVEDAATALSGEAGAEAIRASIQETYEAAKSSL